MTLPTPRILIPERLRPTVFVHSLSSLTLMHPASDDSAGPSCPSNLRTHDVLQRIVKGRKSWKTLKGNSEPVWPPQLEAALIDGLENYQPDDSRETRILGRFPMRNRFISDHIFSVTGKRRTAKQVGSRLQQLRDSYAGKPLLKLLLHSHELDDHTSNHVPSPRKYRSPEGRRGVDRPVFHNIVQSTSDSSTSSGSVSPSTNHPPPSKFPSYTSATTSPPSPPQATIFIDVLPTWSDHNDSDTPTDIAPAQHPSSPPYITEAGADTFRPSPYPRPLWTIDPTVTFKSPSAINAYSIFSVSLNEVVVHTEFTELKLLDSKPEGNDALLYSTPMVPRFWKTICQSEDPTQFTIVQDVLSRTTVQHSVPSGSNNPAKRTDSAVMFSATYKFNCTAGMSSQHHSAPPFLSHASTSDPNLADRQSLPEFSHPDELPRSSLDSFCDSLSCQQQPEPEPFYGFYHEVDQDNRGSEADNASSPEKRHDVSISPTSTCFPSEFFNYIA